jgi:hypothetical protein
MQEELRHGRIPSSVGAGGAFPIEEHVALLATVEKLHESIVAGGETRVDRRTALESREVDVAIGLERTMRKAREAAAPSTMEQPAVGGMQMIDVSEGGMSVLSADPRITQATVSAALADPDVERWLRNQETGRWIIGTVVRKQPGKGRGEVLVGVEVIAYRSIAIELVRTDASAVPALFLPGTNAEGRHDSLLLALADYRAGSRFTIRMGSASYSVELNRIARRGTDWVNARFEIASKG